MVDVVHDGQAALERSAVGDYDVMVLDRDLPELYGDDVCLRTVSGSAQTRTLMPTVSTTVAERVAGLSLGADGHFVEPVAFAELVARIRTLGCRVRPPVRLRWPPGPDAGLLACVDER
ncbi:response regulator [Streptomyces sp. ME19-03-3]|nr:response regulator [Streptomyces sp. ME19-03-3]